MQVRYVRSALRVVAGLCTAYGLHAGQEKAAFENKQKSSIFAWGQGAFGKLGLGSDLNQFDPKLVSALEGLEIKELKTGKTISACIDQDGNILTWGKPINGLLGYGADDLAFNQYTPMLVEKSIGLKFKQMAIGNNHVLAVTEGGEVYSWGCSDNHKLGHSHVDSVKRDLKDRTTLRSKAVLLAGEPKKIEHLTDIAHVDCGLQYSIFVARDGSLSVIGASIKGGLGLGDGIDAVPRPTKVQSLAGVQMTKVVSGSDFSLGLDASGKLYTWGFNNYGQLGNTNKLTNPSPKQVQLPPGKQVADIAVGDNFCLALTKDGGVLSWGCGSNGQLGHGNSQDLSAPKELAFRGKVQSIACGEAHSAFVTTDGLLYTFGCGRDGQIGRGSHMESPASNRPAPVLVDYFSAQKMRVEKVVCGGAQNFAFATTN